MVLISAGKKKNFAEMKWPRQLFCIAQYREPGEFRFLGKVEIGPRSKNDGRIVNDDPGSSHVNLTWFSVVQIFLLTEQIQASYLTVSLCPGHTICQDGPVGHKDVKSGHRVLSKV